MFVLNTKPPYHCIHCAYSQNNSICRYYNGHRKAGSVNFPIVISNLDINQDTDDRDNSFGFTNDVANITKRQRTDTIKSNIEEENQKLPYSSSSLINPSLIFRGHVNNTVGCQVKKASPSSVANHFVISRSNINNKVDLVDKAMNHQSVTDKTQGKHLRLTQCLKCDQLVDEYIQLDNCILFLDAVLQKTSFYRHILLNCTINFKASLRLLVLFSLCDAYKRWTNTMMSIADIHSNGVTLYTFLKAYYNNLSDPLISTILTLVNYTTWEQQKHYHFLSVQSIGTTIAINNSSSTQNSLHSQSSCKDSDLTVENKRQYLHEDYIDSELSFYVAFVTTFISNVLLYYILFTTLKILTKLNYCSYKKRFNFKERLPDYIICSYGKLFTLPNILWGGELRSTIEILIQIFYFISLTQCCYVSNKSISRTRGVITVLVSITIHEIILFSLTTCWYYLMIHYECFSKG